MYKRQTYTRTPWTLDDAYPAHFCHLAIESDGQIAYTPDNEAGYASRKTRVRPGRYLEKFYAHVSLETRQAWIIACRNRDGSVDLARTPDETETVYRNTVGDWHSCMGPDSHKRFSVHPARCYGGPDLAVAYLGPINEALARAVVWPAKKIHSTIYGNPKLREVLEKAGYTRGELDGARIRAIEHDRGGYVMPYVDGIDYADPTGDGYMILGSGDVPTSNTNGRANEDISTCSNCGDRCDRDETYCESCNDDRFDCEHCGQRDCFDTDSAPYCESCNDDRSSCEHCHEDTWDATYEAIGRYGYEITICEYCAENADRYAFTCQHCDESCTEAKYPINVQKDRQANGLATVLCRDCDESGITICQTCDNSLDSGELCPDCPITPRCAATGDLLASLEMS